MLRSLSTLSLVLCLAACASAPVQEMSDARQAISAARAAGAEVRAPADFRAAQSAIERAESRLQVHEYSQARIDAVEAKREASAALTHSQSPGGT